MDEPSGSSALHASPLRPPTVPQASWYQISEIVLAVFRALLHDEDIWSLAVCTRVCRTWRRVATAAAAQASGSVAIATAKVQVLKQDSSIWLDPGIGNAAFADPFGRPPAEQYNRLLHEVLGRGSFARVWGLSGLRNVCVKVAVGGIAASHTVDRKAAEAHTVTLQYGYYTSGCVVRTLSHGEIGMVLYHEFLRVRSISAYSLPPEETRPLYARAQFFGTVGTTAYYTMERLYGCNMRHVLRAADKKHTVDQANIIDFAPLVQRLLRSMHHLVSVYGAFHGDMKPENIMLVADDKQGWRLRLIDPVPIGDDYHLVSLPYNPGAYLDWSCDLASIYLLLIEISSGRRPFERLAGDYVVRPGSPVAVLNNVISEVTPGLAFSLGWEDAYTNQFLQVADALAASPSGKFALRVPMSILPQQVSVP